MLGQYTVDGQLTYIKVWPREIGARGKHRLAIFVANHIGGMWGGAVHGTVRVKGGAQDARLRLWGQRHSYM
jgi:hypothetical protein